jgi:hypothetical protein
MPTTRDEAQAALDQLAVRRGQGRAAENQTNWDTVVGPALTVPFSQRGTAMADAYTTRNTTAGAAQRAAVGGYGSALNAARAQTESEWLRRYLEDETKKRGSATRPSRPATPSTSPVASGMPAPAQPDMWAWMDDYLNRIPTAVPSPRPATQPRPRTYPTVTRM